VQDLTYRNAGREPFEDFLDRERPHLNADERADAR
jgi:hypothetical protein